MTATAMKVLCLCLAALMLAHASAKKLELVQSVNTGKFKSTFEAFTDKENGALVARFTLAPCVSLAAHIHNFPEIAQCVSGEIVVGFVNPAGKLVPDVLKSGDVFVFPKGSLHYNSNQLCKPSTFTATFGTDNPGLQLIASDFSMFPPAFVATSYSGQVPKPTAGLFLVDQKCMKRCNL